MQASTLEITWHEANVYRNNIISMQEKELQQPICSDCPYKKEGITLVFGKKLIHLDPFELMLWILIAVLPVGISIKDAWDGKLEFRESAERVVMISVLGAVVRLSPTEQVSIFLSKINLVKK